MNERDDKINNPTQSKNISKEKIERLGKKQYSNRRINKNNLITRYIVVKFWNGNKEKTLKINQIGKIGV